MTTTTEKNTRLIAFHGKASIQEKYLNRVRKHREADQLIQGYGYWEDGKGCAVGCTLHSANHLDYETELGIPVALAFLEDRLFERLTVEEARQWPERFLAAPKVGADLTLVSYKFAVWLLTTPDGLFQKVIKDKEALDIIAQVAALYERVINGDKPSDSDWEGIEARAREASTRAWQAYDNAARDRALALARDLALDLARARDRALARALDLALDLARDRALDPETVRTFFTLAGEKLLALMAEAPVVSGK